MAVRLFDSLSRDLKPVERSDGKTFRMYCCGPTVYGPAHIGNFRTFILQDVLRRVLELEFGADHVKHVRNLTDVDDKTIRKSRDEQKPLTEITKFWTDKFHADCAELNLLPPHEEPAATTHIAEQVEMIESLMEKGLAYVAADGSAYFRVFAFKEYGKLSHIKADERVRTIAKSLVDDDEYDRELAADFALWKAWKPEDGDVKWPGPKGAAEGRPGWHIECSAMSLKLLGGDHPLDLHAGGVDLLFPHHENEIAQSEGCTGHTFANHWYHTEHLLVDGKKMSKSLGNLYTLEDLKAKGFSPMAIRYTLLSGHPRKQLNFTLDSLHAAEKALNTLHRFRASFKNPFSSQDVDEEAFEPVFSAFRDDLNIPSALGALFSIVNRNDVRTDLVAFDRAISILGLNLEALKVEVDVPLEIRGLAEQRWTAKTAKDFAKADALRKKLYDLGWVAFDRKDGYSLEPLKK